MSDESSHIDWGSFNERYSGRSDFIGQLLKLALNSCETVPSELSSAVSAKNYEDIVFVAHRLKGVAGNLLANGVHDLASETEVSANVKSDNALDKANELIEITESLIIEIKSKLKA